MFLLGAGRFPWYGAPSYTGHCIETCHHVTSTRAVPRNGGRVRVMAPICEGHEPDGPGMADLDPHEPVRTSWCGGASGLIVWSLMGEESGLRGQ